MEDSESVVWFSPIDLQDKENYEKQVSDWPFFVYAIAAARETVVKHLICMLEEPDTITGFVIDLYVFVRAKDSVKCDTHLDELVSRADDAGKLLVVRDEPPNPAELARLDVNKNVLIVYEDAGKWDSEKSFFWELGRMYESLNFSVLLCFSEEKEYHTAQSQMF